ncbi:MAG TPA: hypothetical protein VHO72_14780 [Bacteroidales bacterium]|nr:hypothetical protein [Bacteroidales bacterium]
MNTRNIETVGSLIKVDDVISVQHHILPNTFVLETIEPYPGYHGEVIGDEKPNLIFLVTEEEYSTEHIIRCSSRISKFTNIDIDATKASLQIYNDTYNSIRLRGLLTYDHIKQLQESYINDGYRFMKFKTIKAPALIQLRKPYLLEEVEEGIFRDLDEPMMWYFEIRRKMDWNLLKMMTDNIKNNVNDTNFDAAFGWVFVNGVTDIIRIYAKDLTLDRVKDLQHRYREEIRKYMKL